MSIARIIPNKKPLKIDFDISYQFKIWVPPTQVVTVKVSNLDNQCSSRIQLEHPWIHFTEGSPSVQKTRFCFFFLVWTFAEREIRGWAPQDRLPAPAAVATIVTSVRGSSSSCTAAWTILSGAGLPSRPHSFLAGRFSNVSSSDVGSHRDLSSSLKGDLSLVTVNYGGRFKKFGRRSSAHVKNYRR